MKRREFVGLAGGAAAWPVGANAQSGNKVARIGILWHAANEQEEAPFPTVLREGLRDLGYVEGRNIHLVNTYASENYDRFKENAEKLVASQVDIIVAINLRAALAAQKATQTIPIVFIFVGDPVANKLVSSFARPGGNITGLSQIAEDLAAKRLEIFKNALGVSRAALLVNPSNAQFASKSIEETHSAAASLEIRVTPMDAARPEDLDAAFARMASTGFNSVVVVSDSMFWNERRRIGELALRSRIASMFAMRDHVDAGGLISYGPSLPALVRRAAAYIDKLVRGERAGDIPVERPTRIELVVNLRTARSLGIEISKTILATADDIVD
jgi:putative ABC transport system substrate-binding protein